MLKIILNLRVLYLMEQFDVVEDGLVLHFMHYLS